MNASKPNYEDIFAVLIDVLTAIAEHNIEI